MNITERQPQELSLLMKKTAAEIIDENSSQFSQILENLGLLSEFAGTGPVPLEVWTGIAQAVADASGYSIILNAEMLEPLKTAQGRIAVLGRARLRRSNRPCL